MHSKLDGIFQAIVQCNCGNIEILPLQNHLVDQFFGSNSRFSTRHEKTAP